MKINPNGFREYDARWLYEKDIDLEGITNLGKGLGSQIIKHTKNIYYIMEITTVMMGLVWLKKLQKNNEKFNCLKKWP